MKKSGFTLTEMIVTISILAILLSIAAPNLKTFLSSGNMVANANGMIGAFNYAKTEAIKRGSRVNISQIGSDWASGVVVWVDDDDDDTRDVGEELRLWPAFSSGSSVSSSQASFVFRATGEIDNSDVLTICDDRTGERGRQISILVSGAIIVEKINCA